MINRLFKRKKPSPCVVGIITKEEKILLTKRGKIIPEKDKWCLPGGHMNIGEKVEDTIKRELKEETGLKTKKLKFLFYHDEIIPRLKLHSVVLVFSLKVSGKFNPNFEVSEIKWFSKEEIKKLKLAFTHKEIIKRFFKERKS
ncbi:MAG: NUDIX hydrolase [Candidatus Pacearchaeota archaeon]